MKMNMRSMPGPLSISQFIRLTRLVAALWPTIRDDEVSGGDPMIKFSTVMILARNDDDFGLLKDWELQTPEPREYPWSDDFSNLLGPLIAKFREGD